MTVMGCSCMAHLAFGADRWMDIRDFGAVPDGKTLCTQAIQRAIDECADAGGGTVHLPAGTWLSGTIHMKSHVTLSLGAGCTLLGSMNQDDYPPYKSAIPSRTDRYVCQSLIAGEDLEDIAIVGQGIIDGNGSAFLWKGLMNRPYVIRFLNCRDIAVENIKMRDSPMWMQHYLACDRVRISGITVWNHATWNNDGIDIDACHDVIISNCHLDTDDDGIVFKSTMDRACENVTVTNCVISTHCNAIKVGTETNGGFRNITITNCSILSPRFTENKFGQQRGLAGIALEIVDGGDMDRVAISNITIQGVYTPIFMRLGDRSCPVQEGMPKPSVGKFRNINLNNIVATGTSNIGCSITGLPEHPIENVSLSDISLGFEGGGTTEHADKQVQEQTERYPECDMFGVLPAYGFYCRHVKGLRFRNVRLHTEQPDQRPALVLDDVTGAVIDGLSPDCVPDTRAAIRLVQVDGALVRGCQLLSPVAAFLQVEGNATRNVVLAGNDVQRATKAIETTSEVQPDAIRLSSSELAAEP